MGALLTAASTTKLELTENKWKITGEQYRHPGFKKIRGECILSGVASGGTPLIGVVPVVCRPGGVQSFGVMSEKGPQRIDVSGDDQ